MNLAKNSAKMVTRSHVAKFSASALKASHDTDKRQFVVLINEDLATIDYDLNGNKITFVHTEVPEVFRGKGVGKVLAEEAFTYATSKNLSVQIDCEYLQHYFDTHKDKYKNLKIVV